MLNNILKSFPEDVKKEIEAEKQPGWNDPMLATLSHEHFPDKDWLFERKLNGVRCPVF